MNANNIFLAAFILALALLPVPATAKATFQRPGSRQTQEESTPDEVLAVAYNTTMPMNGTNYNGTLMANETFMMATFSPTDADSAEEGEVAVDVDEEETADTSIPTQAPVDTGSTTTFSITLPPRTPEPTPAPTVPLSRSCIETPVTQDELQPIRFAIETLIDESDTNFAAKFVRLGFHDCVGGCDGCVDMSDPENAGLEVPIEGLEEIVTEFENECISRADIWALAALVGADVTQNEEDFTMDWVGRQNCDANDPTNGPFVQMPSADMDVHGLLDYFNDEFGFNAREVVALMGAHSIGRVDQDNSGFVGRGWDDDNEQLDNDYYRQLRDNVRWNQVDNDNDRFQWEGGRGGSGDADERGIIMLNVDIALVRDFSDDLDDDGEVNCRFRQGGGGGGGGGGGNGGGGDGGGRRFMRALQDNNNVCPNSAATRSIVEEYQDSNSQFLSDFKDVFSQLLVHGYDTSDGCDSDDPCRFPGVSQGMAVSRSGNPDSIFI